jgi:hypothetical protein
MERRQEKKQTNTCSDLELYWKKNMNLSPNKDLLSTTKMSMIKYFNCGFIPLHAAVHEIGSFASPQKNPNKPRISLGL